jgi:hypothetical protein
MSQDKELPTYGIEDDSLASVGFRAYYHHLVQGIRKAVAEIDLQPDRVKRVFAAARAEADRSAAILMFALAEDLMLTAIHRHCNTEIPGGWKDVTEGNGLLATASDRLTFLFIVNWIHPATHANLRLMKAIRNRFAHHADVEGFSDAKIMGSIGSMFAIEKAMIKGVSEEQLPQRPKKLTSWKDLPANVQEIFEIAGSYQMAILRDAATAEAIRSGKKSQPAGKALGCPKAERPLTRNRPVGRKGKFRPTGKDRRLWRP